MGIGVTEYRSDGANKMKDSVSEYKTDRGFAKTFRDLDVYQRALNLAMNIFEITKRFPKEERYSLVDQVRRSSRSICAYIGEAWRKRRYPAAFVAKLSDAETEACETQVWCEIAKHCGYLSESEFLSLDKESDRIIGQIVRMIDSSNRWIIKSPEVPYAVTPLRRDAVTQNELIDKENGNNE